jgi:hypothetical protein
MAGFGNRPSPLAAGAHAGVRILGSAALAVVQVALGHAAAVVLHSVHEWDVAGGIALALESGALISDRHGGPVPTLGNGLLAAGGRRRCVVARRCAARPCGRHGPAAAPCAAGPAWRGTVRPCTTLHGTALPHTARPDTALPCLHGAARRARHSSARDSRSHSRRSSAPGHQRFRCWSVSIIGAGRLWASTRSTWPRVWVR